MPKHHLVPLSRPQFEVPPVPAAEVGTRGKLDWIAISKLFIDESYQRPVDITGKKNIRRIIEQFRWSQFSPIVVSPRPDGAYAIIDGQHRAIAAQLHGKIDKLPCLILSCTPEEEARAFSTINSMITRVPVQYLFRARLAAGDTSAVTADEVCAAAGARIMPYPVEAKQLKVGETLAARTIEICIARYGRDPVIGALNLITKTGDGNPGLCKAEIIEAFARSLYYAPDWLKAFEAVRQVVEKATIPNLLHRGQVAGAEQRKAVKVALSAIFDELLTSKLGSGGQAPKGTLEDAARQALRQGHVPIFRRASRPSSAPAKNAEAASREQAVIRAAASPPKHFRSQPGKSSISAHEREAIDKALKEKGVRKLEAGATGDPWHLLEWLGRVCKRKTARHSTNRGDRRIFEVDGKRYDVQGLFKIVNAERTKRKLEPLTITEAA